MATQTRSKKASSRSKPKSRSANKSRAGATRKPKSRSSSKPKSRPSNGSRSNSSGSPIAALASKPKEAGEAVEETARQAGKAVGRAASKAKVPLVAGGAALAGAAGGIAFGAAKARRHRGIKGVKSDDVVKAAKKAGDIGARVGEIAYEVRRARENTNGHGQTRRSPVEVVLQGLTARHTRG
jgi:hypothetical protein